LIRIHFTAEDLARTRFLPEPAPLHELKLALLTLYRLDGMPRLSRWRRAALTRFPKSARPLWDLIVTFSGSLSPTAVCADIDEAMDAGHHTELVHHGRLLARQGTVGMLTNLVPGARWRDACLEIDTPRHREIRLRGGAWRWRRPTSGRGRRCSPISPTSRS
jgi:hypothetical protein